MRVIAAIAVSLATVLWPNLAAAAIYTFSSTETSALSLSPVSFSFSLDTASAVVNDITTSFSDVTISKNGVLSGSNTIGAMYGTSLGSPFFYLIDTDKRPFYSGAGTAIRFNLGRFAIADGATDGEGTLTIAGSSVVPEPATWGLMFLGMATVGAMRRTARYRQLKAETASYR